MEINQKEFDSQCCHIMGILNVTPDSFSDGGKVESDGQGIVSYGRNDPGRCRNH